MKKNIFMVVLVACISIGLYANEVSAEAGYLPTTAAMNWNNLKDMQYHVSENVLYINLSILFTPTSFFFIGGNTTTFMVPRTDEVQFHPFYTSYTFNTGFYLFRDFEIGYRHSCSHSVDSMGYISDPLLAIDASYDDIYIKYTKEF